MGRHHAHYALLLATTVCTAQSPITFNGTDTHGGTQSEPTKEINSTAWGDEELGFTWDVGTGMYGLHLKTPCPRLYIAATAFTDAILGCTGTEPLNYVSHMNPVALSTTIGYRFSKYVALQFPLTLYAGRANSAAHQTDLDQSIQINATTDIGVRVRGTFPINRQFAVFATAGMGFRTIHGSVDQPAGQQTCVSTALPNPTQPEGPGNMPYCLYSVFQRYNTDLNASSIYIPLSGGLQWYPFQHVGFALGYQPPISKGGIATSEIMLSVLTNNP